MTKLIRKGHKEQPVSDADLLTLVVSGLRSGTLNQDEARVIENVPINGHSNGEAGHDSTPRCFYTIPPWHLRVKLRLRMP